MHLVTMFAAAIFVALLVAARAEDHVKASYYTAAVYEHARFGEFPKNTMNEIIEKNLMAYQKAISAAAKKNADIIVFPEDGIRPVINRTIAKEYADNIPDPQNVRWNPCESAAETLIATNLSCMAKDHNMYLLANFVTMQPCTFTDADCPSDNVYLYNTNVVFDRKGELIARYHKYNLYFELGIDIPKKYEYVAFKTEFAKIGIFVCFDIIWKPSVELIEKYRVDTVIHPSFWIEGLPMYAYIQTTSSWSILNDVNVLAANVQRPSTGAVGSGIFLGASRISHYVYQPNGKSKLIVAKVPIRGSKNTVSLEETTIVEFENDWSRNTYNNISSGQCSTKILGPPKSKFDFRCMDLDLSNFTLVKLQKDGNIVRACNNHLCCMANYDAADMNEDYYLAVINSTYYLSNYYAIWEEVCMVTRCDQYNGTECSTFPTKSKTVFRALSIKANITSAYVYPSVLTSGMQLLDPQNWSYTRNSLSLRTDDGLLFAVLNGRDYNRDPPYPRSKL